MRNPPDEALSATDTLPSSPPASGRGPRGGRPASAKGVYMQRVYVSSTMGPGVEIDRATIIEAVE